ncbi:MAG TPA: hypothetical protein VET85_13035 [Stellaceae bacterium]|nr:hypothetical protein [Stellaceae bacterium]
MAEGSRNMQDNARPTAADAGNSGRDLVLSGRELALSDEHIFPPLRLMPISGETPLENMLRQIDALTQGAKVAPPQAPRPVPAIARKKPPTDEASPPSELDEEPAPGTPLSIAKIRAMLGLGVVLLCALLIPSNARFFHGWLGPQSLVVVLPAAPVGELRAINVLPVTPAGPAAPVSPPRPAATDVSPPAAASPGELRAPPLRIAAPPALATIEPTARGSLEPPPAPETAVAPPLPPEQATPPPQRAPDSPVALLLERGNQLLAAGDITSARQFYARAAETEAGAAAAAMGKTYDPLFLQHIGAVGMYANVARASDWYRRAAAAGDGEAAIRLARLERETRLRRPGEAPVSSPPP